MYSPKADLILHPVRMRVIMALSTQPMTAGQLSALLPEVPPATLYRHLSAMTKGEILAIVEERPVRGTVEKVYALASPSAAHLTQADFDTMTPEDHMHLFTAFVVTLLGDFARYLQRDTVNAAQDGVGFHKYPIYLNDEEMVEFGKKLSEVLMPLMANPPEGRQRRLFSLILMPDDTPPPENS